MLRKLASSVSGRISTPKNDSDKGPITLRKSVKDSPFTVRIKDFPETNDEAEILDQIYQGSRLQSQNTRQNIQSSVKESGQKMKQDIYNMLFLEKSCGPAFFFALFSIFFQYVILGFLMYDLLKPNSSHNFLGIPAGVTEIVAVAQAFGVILAVLSSHDLLDALAFLDIIFHRQIFDIVPNATRCSWFFTWLLKFTEGSASLLVTFILILKSETVLELFQNFAAVSFVFTIDNLFFELAKNGFFGDRVAEGAFSTSVITLPKNATRRSICIRNSTFYLILIAMLISWGFVYNMQRNGYFFCNHVLTQFGDSYEPVTSQFSGHFRLENLRLYGRAVYTNRRNTDTEYPFIGYCESKKVWTLSLYNVTNGYYDSCSSPLAWSPTTSTFDVTTAGNSWVSTRRNDTKQKSTPYSFMKLECIDCAKDLNPSRDKCSFSGKCGYDGLCQCNKGNYGPSCEYKEPCPVVIFRRLNDEYNYQLFQNEENELVLVQEKPVYFNVDDTQEINATNLGNQQNRDYFLIFFNGYRWVLSYLSSFEQFNSTTDGNIESELADYLRNKFHPHYSIYDAVLMTAPVPQSLPGDAFAPTNLIWYNTRFEKNSKQKNKVVSNRARNYKPMRCDNAVENYYDDDEIEN